MSLLALALALSAPPAAAQEGPQAVLAEGERLEVETRADFDGDGLADLAYVAAREETRELRVVVGQTVQTLTLAPFPLVDATLAFEGKVLLFDELNGGTTAVASTRRFRWDDKLGAMRLIGLDATFYSRTFAHDGKQASWNLLTGDWHTHTMRLRNDDSGIAYDEVDKRRRKKRSKPLRLEDAPSGDDLLGWPGGGR
ncbi:hypothetical protein [Porphyrobacter sp. AAP60]|uniref:hypothetical protein n=1 Tax=Porphyrobacter sp. AAP60 TaxID=1523423 RepID=UPI0006B9AAD9|nr:hypothetical protein [Porphyrobacter sp. AAP60]